MWKCDIHAYWSRCCCCFWETVLLSTSSSKLLLSFYVMYSTNIVDDTFGTSIPLCFPWICFEMEKCFEETRKKHKKNKPKLNSVYDTAFSLNIQATSAIDNGIYTSTDIAHAENISLQNVVYMSLVSQASHRRRRRRRTNKIRFLNALAKWMWMVQNGIVCHCKSANSKFSNCVMCCTTVETRDQNEHKNNIHT